MANRLKDKVCLVTGATSGIGRATVLAFVAEGAKVVFAARREEKGKALEEEVRANGGEAYYVQADLQKADDCKKIVDKTIELFGRIDVLMNNAGVGTVKPFLEYDMKTDYENVMNLNLTAYVLTCKEAIPYMIKQGAGNIVNVASLGAFTAMPLQASYAASKGGVIQFTRTLAVEFAKNNIRANTISPGLTITEMVPQGSEAEKLLRSIVPGLKAGTAEGVANAAVFCASDEVPFMSGANIMIDGATNCGPCLPI